METENVVIVNQAGEKVEAIPEDKCLTDDSKELDQKLAAEGDSKVETVGGAGENVKVEKEEEPADAMEEEDSLEDALEDSAEKEDLEDKNEDSVEDTDAGIEKLTISEEVEAKEDNVDGDECNSED
ncbi:hypothetical protein M8J76_003295 [Diaphorina citri]|nr:hypothetical protein M8J76_003295 [Diaphorina citri]KAI5755747.1 hypothetical protein M8J77_019318 [Diaphorina citri]